MTTRRLIRTLVSIAAIGGSAHTSPAQDAPQGNVLEVQVQPERLVEPQPMGVIDFGFQAVKRQREMAEHKREKLHRYLALRIDELKRVCQLSDRQTKTLEIAAKGAVEQSMKKWQRQIEADLGANAVFEWRAANIAVGGAVGLPPVIPGEPIAPPAKEAADADVGPAVGPPPAAADEGIAPPVEEAADVDVGVAVGRPPAATDEGIAPPVEEEEEEIKVIAKPQAAIPALPAAPVVVRAPAARVWRLVPSTADLSDVAKELVWTKTIDRVLTAEQKKAYDEVLARRRLSRREAAVNRCVTRIDQEFLLSDGQREQLKKLVDEILEKQLLDRPQPNGSPEDLSAIDNAAVSNLVHLIPREKIERVLTGPQLAWWDELRQAGGVQQEIRVEEGGGFFQIDAVPVGPAIDDEP